VIGTYEYSQRSERKLPGIIWRTPTVFAFLELV
jgi:hypothetical protein